MAIHSDLSDFSGADIFDIRDLIDRFEKLESLDEDFATLKATAGDNLAAELAIMKFKDSDDFKELSTLREFLEEVAGNGGCHHQWRGDWYPVTFIAESYFVDYCEEMCKDIGDLPSDIPGYLVIDWEKAADKYQGGLQQRGSGRKRVSVSVGDSNDSHT